MDQLKQDRLKKSQRTENNLLIHKKIRAAIEQRLLPEDKFYKLAGRVLTCHDNLLFKNNPKESNKGAYIARVTCKSALFCPHCSANLSRKRSIAFNQAVEKIKTEDESSTKRKFIFFTLTAPAVHISKLSETYNAMSLARSALMKRVSQKASKFKLGNDFISKFKFNYSTKNTDYIADICKKMTKKAGHINPYFHVLIWAPLDFNNAILENFESELAEIWYKLLTKFITLDNKYANTHQKLITDVRLFANSDSEDFTKVFELIKYPVKHTDIQSMYSQHFAAFLLALTGKKLFSSGGVFRNLKMIKIED